MFEKPEPMIKITELMLMMTQKIKMYLYTPSFQPSGIYVTQGKTQSNCSQSIKEFLPSGRIASEKIKTTKKQKKVKKFEIHKKTQKKPKNANPVATCATGEAVKKMNKKPQKTKKYKNIKKKVWNF